MTGIGDDLAIVFAGVVEDTTDFDAAAVRVAEYLVELSDAVMTWVTTPGPHGGNPYTHDFVRKAEGVTQ